jgi:hypothetical protein
MNFLKSGKADSSKDAQKFAQTKQKSSVWDCESSLYDSFELRSFISLLNQALVEVSSSTPDRSPRAAAAGCIRSLSTPRTAGPRFVTDSMHCTIHNTLVAEKDGSCSDLNKEGILSRPVKKLLMRVFRRKTVQHRRQLSETGELCRCHKAEVQSNFVLRKCGSERMSSQTFDGLRRKK